ncbi:hypothetical protein ABI59_05740 [Acidobacteria bacterium Mor1]|nr:hypothetical protein ABI59_05740 [Acidobacteria bacterium Mor1]
MSFLCAGSAFAGDLSFPLNARDPLRGSDASVDGGSAATHMVFFATWCPPCRDELPQVRELSDRWSGRGYKLLLVAVSTRQTEAKLKEFAERKDPPGTLLFDRDNKVGAACGVQDVPTHLVVDGQGNIVLRADGFGPEVEQAVERLVRGRN